MIVEKNDRNSIKIASEKLLAGEMDSSREIVCLSLIRTKEP